MVFIVGSQRSHVIEFKPPNVKAYPPLTRGLFFFLSFLRSFVSFSFVGSLFSSLYSGPPLLLGLWVNPPPLGGLYMCCSFVSPYFLPDQSVYASTPYIRKKSVSPVVVLRVVLYALVCEVISRTSCLSLVEPFL